MDNPVYSMTGFCDGAATTDAFSLRVEIACPVGRDRGTSRSRRCPVRNVPVDLIVLHFLKKSKKKSYSENKNSDMHKNKMK